MQISDVSPFNYALLTYLLRPAPVGAQAINNSPPAHSILGCITCSLPAQFLGFKLGLSVTPPTVAGSASPSLPLGIPTQGLSCYVGWWFPQRMAYPAPLPLEDLFGQRFLPCSLPQVSVAYSVWPSDAKDTAKTRVDKALDLLV